MFGGSRAGRRHRNNFAQEFANLVHIFDHRFGDDVDEGIDNEVHDNAFDALDVEAQKKSPMRRCDDGVVSKQNGQSTFAARRKDVFLLQKIGATLHGFVIMQRKKNYHKYKDEDKFTFQRNIEHIRGLFANGSWIREPQNT